MTLSDTTLADFLHLTHRPDLGLVAARWARPTSSSELRAGYQALLRYAGSCGQCCHWLVDSRRRLQVDARDVHWLTEEFYPVLRQQLQAHVYLAFLLAPYQLDQVQDDTLPPLPYTHGDYCSLNQFTDEGEAVRWLMAQR